MRKAWGLLASGLLLAGNVWGNPVISEFMADNLTTLADENGDFSDWIEIHNPTATPLALDGYFLTDTVTNLAKWAFPTVTLQPGEFLVVWASSKNRRVVGAPLHTNFSLAKSGEYLGLVGPGSVAVQAFAPTFPALSGDQSYGPQFITSQPVASNEVGRYKIPVSASDPAEGWREASFVDSAWPSGPGGFGFGVSVPGIAVTVVNKATPILSLNDALALLALPPGSPAILRTTSEIHQTVNFLGDGASGNYEFDAIPPGGGGDHYVAVASGTIVIPTAGIYTFGLNSDDGGQILIDGMEILRDNLGNAAENTLAAVNLPAGVHTFRALQYQIGGGDCFEFFAAPGLHEVFNPLVFDLVGDVANGGLAASTTSPGSGGLLGTNLMTVMAGRADAYLRIPFDSAAVTAPTVGSLVMRYNDGFAAWLNGTAIATANAPATPLWDSVATAPRTSVQTLRKQGFNVTSQLTSLVEGANVLAIQGLNSTPADPSFLVSSELILGQIDPVAASVFYGGGLATPGWINGAPSSLGQVADTSFSMDRGFFTAPISVEITCATPDSVIRYTTDGSSPTATYGTIYTGPLALSATTVVRACASRPNWTSTDIDTHTYLFLDDVIRQSANGSPPPGWPATSGTDQIMYFGMDQRIVNHPNPDIGGPASVKAALLALPSVSVTTDLSNLFDIDGSKGIYSNAWQHGFAWERPVSMEWLTPPDAANPNGKGEFQINAGIRMRGAGSRSSYNPKHSLRFFFREEYGAAKLQYPLFGQDAAQTFDKIDFRTSQNYSWSFNGDSRNTFLREESSRQALVDLGQPGSHLRYIHVYLNGCYWGLYDLDERTDASFGESYLGGKKEEYDVVKSTAEFARETEATNGDLVAWRNLWDLGKAHRAAPTNENYFRMMGLAADGVTPTTEPVLLDSDNLIDYLMLTFWMGNLDGATSAFLGENIANNWFTTRRRVGNERRGFIYFAHDFEHTLFNINEDRTGPFVRANESNFAFSNPLYLHQDLTGNTEYRMRWADRVHRHMFNGGQLTPTVWQNRITKLAAVVDGSIIAESARWGAAQTATPLTKQDWVIAQNEVLNHLPGRNAVVLNQLRADGLYPMLDAPVLTPAGGYQQDGVQVTLQGPSGSTLYYMPDGSDPRAVGGALRPGAVAYASIPPAGEPLIPISSSGWKYRGNGSDQGTAWRTAGFNDSTWATGTSELGYGDQDEATLIPIVDVDPSTVEIEKPATCYFRRSFSAANISQITTLALSIEYDDAFAVYLNGARIAGNLPLNPAYDYYTGSAIDDTIGTFTIPPSALLEGVNTLCVEIHQATTYSSDLSMNLSLSAARASAQPPLILTGTGERILRFRARSGATWSALSEAVYQLGTTPPTPANLVVSEISYAPLLPDQDAEFIELLNTSATVTLDLTRARFTEGIEFTFPAGTQLAPGGRVLVVKNLAAFTQLYGTGKPIAGIFKNATGLSNTGERLRLETPDGSPLLDFTYGIAFPWPALTNGLGRSMILTNPSDPTAPASWRPSTATHGNPGTSDTLTRPPGLSLLDYAIPGPAPTFDRTTGSFSVTRRLGADAAALTPQWSTDLLQWSPQSLTLTSDTPDAFGNSTLNWQLPPTAADKMFLRLQVTEKP